jgi:hypothetical protein
MKPASEGARWSRHIEALIHRAEVAGYELRPRGEPPYGWHLIRGAEMILEGVLMPVVEAEMNRRKI